MSFFCSKECEKEAVLEYVKDSGDIWCCDCLAWMKLAIDRCAECGSRYLYPRVRIKGIGELGKTKFLEVEAANDPAMQYIEGLKAEANEEN